MAYVNDEGRIVYERNQAQAGDLQEQVAELAEALHQAILQRDGLQAEVDAAHELLGYLKEGIERLKTERDAAIRNRPTA